MLTCMKPEMNTEVTSTKKLIRQEKKKKKMLAYLEVAKLNDLDRIKTEVNTQNDLCREDEPSSKKAKTEDQDLIENNNITENEIMLNKYDTTRVSEVTKPFLTGDEYVKLKRELRERKTKYRNIPRFALKTAGDNASLSVPAKDRTPLFLSDVQNLILFALTDKHASYSPHRWCFLDRPTKMPYTVVIVLENVSMLHYTSGEQHFPNISEIFTNKVEIITPSVYRGNLIQEIAAVPLTKTLQMKFAEEYGSLDAALDSAHVFTMLRAVFPVQETVNNVEEAKLDLPAQDKFPRTHILLSAWQLVESDYPLPLKGPLREKYSDYIQTKDIYEEVTPHSPMYGLDCEMCLTTTGQNELTRISIVNEKHESIYDKLVQPYNRIINYLTRFSGITAEMLRNVAYRLEDVQRDIRELLPANAILVGQSLNFDLHALKMMHPYVIDTSVIFNLTGCRNRKSKLQLLAREFLHETIQQAEGGHDPIEDSLSSLKLAQLKLANGLEYGDAVLSGQHGCLRDIRNVSGTHYGSSLLHQVTKINKSSVVIGQADCIERYKQYIHDSVPLHMLSTVVLYSNPSIVEFVCQTAADTNFSLAHMSIDVKQLAEDTRQETFEFIDKSVRRIWSGLADNAMCIVLFGGETGGNGACFVQVKSISRNAL